MYFPLESPPGWWVGNLVTKTMPLQKNGFWVNFTDNGYAYTEDNDVKVFMDRLTRDTYATEWVMIAPKTFREEKTAEEETTP